MRIVSLSIPLIPILVSITVFSLLGAGVATAEEFDRSPCAAQCRCAWGLFQACMDCRQRCESERWKQFDRQMDRLEESGESDARRSQR